MSHAVLAPLGAVLNEPQPGDILDGRFKILQMLNRGGMSCIYEALDRTNGKSVAVKLPLLFCESDPGFHSRFEREEMIGLSLDHPCILKFIRCEEKSRPYIVTEYLEGQTLAARLQESPPLTEREITRLGSQICDALDYLHRNGIIHRDLKPENIMLCEDGTIRIMDFGIAKAAAARRLTFGGFSSLVGTPDYIAPEQVRGKRGDARTDIYSLGAMLYVMTTGTAPYEGDNAYVIMNSRLSGDPEAPRQRKPDMSLQMEEIILHAMERDPSDRFYSAADMKTELEDYAKVTLIGRFRNLHPPQFLSAFTPLWRNMAMIVAVQIFMAVILFLHFSHQHGRHAPVEIPQPLPVVSMVHPLHVLR